MPGAMIIANAIHSLHQFGVVKEPTFLWKLAAAAVPIVIVSIVLGWLPGPELARSAFAFVATILIMATESWLLLKGNYLPPFIPEDIWVDATLPCIGVIVHHWFEGSHTHSGAAHAAPS